jgi:hypothetical protein
MDMLTDIGMYVNTATKEVCWEDHSIPLRERGELMKRDDLLEIYHVETTNNVLSEAERRHARILDADYSKQDLEEFVKELNYLTDTDKSLLLRTLRNHEKLFQGGLGT